MINLTSYSVCDAEVLCLFVLFYPCVQELAGVRRLRHSQGHSVEIMHSGIGRKNPRGEKHGRQLNVPAALANFIFLFKPGGQEKAIASPENSNPAPKVRLSSVNMIL